MAFAPKRTVLYDVESTSALSFHLPLRSRQTEGIREVEICITGENEPPAERMDEGDDYEYSEYAVNGVGDLAIH